MDLLIIREKNISGKVGDFVRELVSKTGNFPLAPLDIILFTIFPIHVDSALLMDFIDKELCKIFMSTPMRIPMSNPWVSILDF